MLKCLGTGQLSFKGKRSGLGIPYKHQTGAIRVDFPKPLNRLLSLFQNFLNQSLRDREMVLILFEPLMVVLLDFR